MRREENRHRVRLGLALASAALVAASPMAEEVVKRGGDIGDSPQLSLTDALEDPAAHADRTVVVEGKVDKVCPVKGCWMELMPEGESRGVRVTFENYGFFVPKDSMGWKARLEGKFVREELSKRAVDHLVGEGATLEVRADGTAAQYSFVATAVELRPPDAEA